MTNSQFSNEKYDLEERTAKLAEEIIRTVKRLLAVANPEIKDQLRVLYRETQELLLIFSKILKSSRANIL